MKTETGDAGLDRRLQFEGKVRQGAFGKWLGGIASLLSSTAGIKCPFCVPALGALLTSLGLGAAVTAQLMHGLLVALLLLSVGSLAWAAKFHRRWWVLPVGALGAAAVYAARYVWFEPVVLWLGVAALVGTSIINLRIKRACCRCQTQG